MTDIAYPIVSEFEADDAEHRRKISRVLNRTVAGKLNATTSFTLTANVGSSTLTDSRISVNSFIALSPTTANAAAEIGNGTIYVSARTVGSATITHANNAQTDRTYTVLIIG